MAKKKVTKKKNNVRQKQKQKQSINININSNNKKSNANKPPNPKPIPQYMPSGHTTTIVGGTGRGSEMLPIIQQPQSVQPNLTEVEKLLKSMVKGSQDFSGIGKLFSKVDNLANRQSMLESRLTHQYGMMNDVEDSPYIHYNEEFREPVQNYGLGRKPNLFFYPSDYQSAEIQTVHEADNMSEVTTPPEINQIPEQVQPNEEILQEDALPFEDARTVGTNDFEDTNIQNKTRQGIYKMQDFQDGTPIKEFKTPRIETGFKPQDNIMPQQPKEQNTIENLGLNVDDIDLEDQLIEDGESNEIDETNEEGHKSPHQLVKELKAEDKEFLKMENEKLNAKLEEENKKKLEEENRLKIEESRKKQEDDLRQIREQRNKEFKTDKAVGNDIDEIIESAKTKNINLQNIKEEYDNILKQLENSDPSSLRNIRKKANKLITSIETNEMRSERGTKNSHLTTEGKEKSILRVKEFEQIVNSIDKYFKSQKQPQQQSQPKALPPPPLSQRTMTMSNLPKQENKDEIIQKTTRK